MNQEAVVARTEKGEAELRTRGTGLDRQLRYILIMVDGQSTVTDLARKGAVMKEFTAGLVKLAQQGYVEIAGHAAANLDITVANAKDELVRIAHEVMGGHAESVVERILAAPDTLEGLLEVTGKCKKMVRLLIDEALAETLANRCRAVLEGLRESA